MALGCFMFVLVFFVKGMWCMEDTKADEPVGCSQNADYVINYLLTKVDGLQSQLHSLQLALKDEKQLMMQMVNDIDVAVRQEMRASTVRQSQELDALNASLTLELQEIKAKYKKDTQLMLAQIDKLTHGSMYVRWGKSTCGSNDTERVYSGFTSGSPHDLQGGAASFLCLPQNPTWAKYVDGIQNFGGYVSGTEYEIYDAFKPFPRSMQDQDAPCAVCRSSRPTTITIPGRTNCDDGWTMEYTGYLMTGHKTQTAATDYACVDSDPEAVYHGGANLNGKLFYYTEVKCGSLPCQEYPDGRELACVVCSK